jgi:chemotaxis protein CheX
MSNVSADNVLKLPAVADLTFATALKQQCEQALSSGTGLTVDASETQRIGTPCLQVLVTAAKCFEKAGGATLVIANPSGAFAETAATLGLSASLKLTGA